MRERFTSAHVLALIAIVLAIAGNAVAFTLGKNSVGSKQLKKNAVTTAKIKQNSVTTAKIKNQAITSVKVKNGTLTGAQIDASTLGTVPNAANATNAASAANSDALGGSPPSAFLPSSGVRADGFASVELIEHFESKTITDIASKSFTAPSAGFIYLTGSVSTEVSNGPFSRGELLFRLALDGEPLEETDTAHGISTNEETEVFTQSGSTTAVVPVSAGPHTVALQAWEAQKSEDIRSRNISILFVPNGSASSFPLSE
jgi:hypothetical protein